MSALFEEHDYRPTPMGVLSLRRRRNLSDGGDIYEVKLDDQFLMSSLFTASEIAAALQAGLLHLLQARDALAAQVLPEIMIGHGRRAHRMSVHLTFADQETNGALIKRVIPCHSRGATVERELS